MKNKIGIMQGRLSHSINNTIQAFPEKSWIEEFELSQKINLNSMETNNFEYFRLLATFQLVLLFCG